MAQDIFGSDVGSTTTVRLSGSVVEFGSTGDSEGLTNLLVESIQFDYARTPVQKRSLTNNKRYTIMGDAVGGGTITGIAGIGGDISKFFAKFASACGDGTNNLTVNGAVTECGGSTATKGTKYILSGVVLNGFRGTAQADPSGLSVLSESYTFTFSSMSIS